MSKLLILVKIRAIQSISVLFSNYYYSSKEKILDHLNITNIE